MNDEKPSRLTRAALLLYIVGTLVLWIVVQLESYNALFTSTSFERAVDSNPWPGSNLTGQGRRIDQ